MVDCVRVADCEFLGASITLNRMHETEGKAATLKSKTAF
jgi:hypothetical protein